MTLRSSAVTEFFLSFTGAYLQGIRNAIIKFNIFFHVGMFNVVMIMKIVMNYVLNIICKSEITKFRLSTMLRLGVTDKLNEKKIKKNTNNTPSITVI